MGGNNRSRPAAAKAAELNTTPKAPAPEKLEAKTPAPEEPKSKAPAPKDPEVKVAAPEELEAKDPVPEEPKKKAPAPEEPKAKASKTALITAPVATFTGESAGVRFENGRGKTSDPWLIAWFKEHGYKVEFPGK